MGAAPRTLLLGLGNELVAGDDLGLRVVRRLRRAGLPPNLSLIHI